VLRVTAPLLGIAAASATAFEGFQSSMNRVSALGDIVGKDLDKLKAQAIDLGAKTQYSAKQAADGMGELAASGFNTTQIMQAMPAVLALAASGQMEVGRAAEVASNVMAGFKIPADQVSAAVDVMAKAAAAGSLNVSDLALTFKYIGPAAQAAGLSFQEMAAATTIMSNAGIKGEQAGTSLRQAISRLLDPPKAAANALKDLGIETLDATGKMRPMVDIIADLNTKGATTSQMFKIFGQEAASGMLALKTAGAPALQAMTTELQNSEGAAAKMAGTLNSGLGGAMERMKGSIETAGIALGEGLAPTIIKVAGLIEQTANKVADFAKWFNTLPEPVQNTAIAFAAAVAAIGPLILVAGTLTSAVASIGTAFSLIAPALVAFAATTIPSAIAAVTTFATTAIPAAISALTTFALTTIPQTVTAMSVVSEVMLRDAVGSFVTFAKTAVPAAIEAMTVFVTVTIPEAIAAVTTFSVTTIPQMTASFVSLASTGVAGATSAITAFATTTIPAAISAVQTLALTALPLLGVAAAAGAAAFAGWNIGKWAYDAIPGVKALGDSLASLILYIPGVQSLIDRMGGLTKATSDLEGGTKKLEALASKLGVNITDLSTAYKSGAISIDKYDKGLNELIRTKMGAASAAKAVTDATGKATKATTQAAKAFDTHAKATKAAAEHLSPFIKRSAELDETARQLTATYQKGVSDVVKWKLAHQDAASVTPKLTQVTDELNESIQKMVSSAKLIAPTFLDAAKQAEESMRAAVKPIQDLDNAYKTLGITSSRTLSDQAQEASKAYETIRASGTASAHDLDVAWVKMEESRISAAKAAGVEIPRETQATLDKVKASIEGHTKETGGQWSDWSKQVSTIITDLGANISGVLWDGDKSWGEKGMSILKSLGDAVTRAFVEPATKAIGDLISGAISDLLGGKGFGGIVDSIKNIGSTITDVFGGAASAAGGIVGALGNSGDILSAASNATRGAANTADALGTLGSAIGASGNAAGAAGSAASGASGAASKVAGSAITGVVGAVSGVVSAVSAVIGNFQMAHQETSLNAIEHNTRYTMMYVGERGDGGILGQMFLVAANTSYLPGLLDAVNAKLDNWLEPAKNTLQDISGQMNLAIAKFDDISSNTYWGLRADQDNTRLLGEVRDSIRSQRDTSGLLTEIRDGIRSLSRPAAASTTAASNLSLQGVRF
jgi:TP901 family phage tail tape measure protein